MAKDLGLFEKEIAMYNTTIPQQMEILNKNNKKENFFSAGCLKTQIDPKSVLILQDLSPYGYQIADRRTGLDLDHCMLVLERIAKFHASSAALYHKVIVP